MSTSELGGSAYNKTIILFINGVVLISNQLYIYEDETGQLAVLTGHVI